MAGERGPVVTRREADVLAAVAERLTNAEIAERLYVSERTVESHVSSLLRKFGVSNRIELAVAAKARGAGLVPRRLPAPLELLADGETFCGRRAEEEALLALWDTALAGQLRVVVVEGEEGIGKTRLVAEVARQVHEGGARVLLGSCFEDVQLPYGPFVQILGSEGAEAPGGPLTRLAPETHDAGVERAAAAGAPDPAAGQAEVCAAFHDYLCRWGRREPLLVVVEDVHWSTDTTRAALRHFARAGGHVPVLCILTTRDTPPELDERLVAFLGDLSRYPCVSQVSLTGLDRAEVGALLEHLGGSADASVIASETGGNPLFVREMAAAPSSAGRSLVALVTRRYARLPADDLDVLDTAAVVGREFATDLVAAACGRPRPETLAVLERAEAAGLVAADPDDPVRFSFTHALLRTARYDSLPTSRRLTVHQRVARVLAERAGAGGSWSELARHACIAAPLGHAEAALGYAVRAARDAEWSFAFAEAAGHYRRALGVADLVERPDSRRTLELSVRLGEMLHEAGDAAWLDVLLDAADVARDLGDGSALADIVSATNRFAEVPRAAWWYGSSGGWTSFSVIVQEALAALGPVPSVARARVLTAAADDLVFADPDTALTMADEAWDIVHALDDPDALGDVLASYCYAGLTPDNARARHPTADELVALGQRTGRRALTILGLAHRAWSHRENGDLASARVAVEEAYAVQAGHAIPPRVVIAPLMQHSALLLLAGDLAAAEALADRAWLLADATFDPTIWHGVAIAGIRLPQGRLPELVAFLEAGVEQPAGAGQWYLPGLSLVHAYRGRIDDARDILENLCSGGSVRLPRSYNWLAVMVGLAATAEWTRCAGPAAAIGEQLEPFSGRIASFIPSAAGTIDFAIAQTALTAGDPARAEHFAEKAVAASRARATPIFLGRELIRLAAARRALGSTEAAVRPLVTEALDLADKFGAPLIRAEAERYELVAAPTLR